MAEMLICFGFMSIISVSTILLLIAMRNKKPEVVVQEVVRVPDDCVRLSPYLKGEIAERPMRTANSIDFVGDNIVEMYIQPNGTKIFRALHTDGTDLGIDFRSISGAILALDMYGTELEQPVSKAMISGEGAN